MSEALSLPGLKVLLIGPSGTGKTRALGTLADWCEARGKELFVLFTENGAETLLGYWRDRDLSPPKSLHYHNALTQPVSLKNIMIGVDNTGKMSYELLTQSKDNNRGGENNAFYKILQACADFPDDLSGKKFGAVDSWGVDKVFAIDSLSEVANASMKTVIGSRPTASPGDYGVAMNNLLNFLRLCTQSLKCTFVLTGHVDKQVNEISGTTQLMVKSLGKALAADIPPLFSEVILTVREGDKFSWSTATHGVDTKTRSLGYRAGIAPDFAQLMDTWTKRGGK